MQEVLSNGSAHHADDRSTPSQSVMSMPLQEKIDALYSDTIVAATDCTKQCRDTLVIQSHAVMPLVHKGGLPHLGLTVILSRITPIPALSSAMGHTEGSIDVGNFVLILENE